MYFRAVGQAGQPLQGLGGSGQQAEVSVRTCWLLPRGPVGSEWPSAQPLPSTLERTQPLTLRVELWGAGGVYRGRVVTALFLFLLFSVEEDEHIQLSDTKPQKTGLKCRLIKEHHEVLYNINIARGMDIPTVMVPA